MNNDHLGQGRYDDLCTEAREKAKARGCVLIILDGDRGHGLSVQLPPQLVAQMPSLLRATARAIEVDQQQRKGN